MVLLVRSAFPGWSPGLRFDFRTLRYSRIAKLRNRRPRERGFVAHRQQQYVDLRRARPPTTAPDTRSPGCSQRKDAGAEICNSRFVCHASTARALAQRLSAHCASDVGASVRECVCWFGLSLLVTSNLTPSPPNPPLEGEGLERECPGNSLSRFFASHMARHHPHPTLPLKGRAFRATCCY